MLSFGIFFLTSWISSFLSLAQELPMSNGGKLTTTRVLFNQNKLATSQYSFSISPKQSAITFNATLLPSRFLNIDWKKNESKPVKTQINGQQKTGLTNQNHHFCSAVEDMVAEYPEPQSNTLALASPKIIELSSTNHDFFSQRILQTLREGLPPALQNFFRFSESLKSRFDATTLPVVVVSRDEGNYEVWLNDRKIANLPNQVQASAMQQRLTKLLKSPVDASQLRPAIVDGKPALMAGNRFLFGINQEVTQTTIRSGDLIAVDWVNNLRSALKAPVLSLVQAQLEMYGLTPSNQKLSGLASWYGDYFHGRTTANGETYNQNDLTVAHKSLPFNTFLKVTNLKTQKSVVVRVNDRGPYIPPRSLDLSREAARCIQSETAGVVPYEAVIMQPSQPNMALNATLAAKEKKPTQTEF